MAPAPRKPNPPSGDFDHIPSVIFSAISSSEDRHVKSVEELRAYFVSQVDELRRMIERNVSKEEMREKLEQVRQEVVEVKQDVSDVSERLDTVETNIMKKIDAVSEQEQEKLKKNYMRVIAFQSAILLPIITGVIVYILQNILHH